MSLLLLLSRSAKSIIKIARAVGYDSQSRFTAAFKTYFKVLPKEYRKKFPS
ncbi:helix-turn-helix domain-containing protein [Petralouisia muris]|jgi:AraC-like DNA-binding protein|uniref:helix-turn-helix domain-containing protein n=1 Tax=Petralouisia muris TaxID=3032872 RepID=UPI0023B79A61|nr:helix-turn-helix domain-containing protein [Petralouisia muris]